MKIQNIFWIFQNSNFDFPKNGYILVAQGDVKLQKIKFGFVKKIAVKSASIQQ